MDFYWNERLIDCCSSQNSRPIQRRLERKQKKPSNVCAGNSERISSVILNGYDSTFSLDFAETLLFGVVAAQLDGIGGDVAKKS